MIIFFVWLLSIARQIAAPSGVIGVNLEGNKSKGIYIKQIAPNMPANQSGLQKNDYIISVDDKPMQNKNKHYVISKITGKPNTEVKSLIKRENKEIEYNVKRVQRKIKWFIFF